jgi:peptide/nickel transport system substrate-binding protein
MSQPRPPRRFTRRTLLRLAMFTGGATATGGLLAACQTSTPTAPVAPSQAAVEGAGPSARAGAPAAAAAARPSEWNVVIPEQTGGGDPVTEYGTNAQYYLLRHVLEPLLQIELLPDGKSWGVVNYLADGWSFTDNKTLVVAVRQGVRFHNGEELTAEHVKTVYDSMMAAPTPGRRAVALRVLGQAVVDSKYQLTWHMLEPNISVLANMFQLLIPALARHEMAPEQFERAPLGTGPYKVIDWPRDGTVRLEAWDQYRLGKAIPEKLTVRYVPEPSTRVLELLSGGAQIAQSLSFESLASIEADSRLEVVGLRGMSTLPYAINLFKTTPPLQDRRVRQAMNYAIDREAIVRSILGGRGAPLPGPLWEGWLGYSGEIKPYPYDPERAKALLAEAGHPEGFSFSWAVTQGVYPKDAEIAQVVANQLARVGIKATLQPMDRARLLAARSAGDYDVLELTWPVSWLAYGVFQSTLVAGLPDDKLSPAWGPPPPALLEARRLHREAGTAANLEEMGAIHARLNRFMHDEAFWLYVHTYDDFWGIQKDTRWRPYPHTWSFFYDHWAIVGSQAPSDPIVPLILSR